MALITEYEDLTECQRFFKNDWECLYKVTQKTKRGTKTQLVRVELETQNYFSVKREKDLLQYLNQFEEDFPRFNEIRKKGFDYLQFFDYVGKKTLGQWVKKQKGLPSKTVKMILANMVSSLKHVHQAGFVHTQLTPDTILVGKHRFYLTHFSEAIPALHSYESEVMPKDINYCPPERMNGQFEDSSDIYALGCVLYFALTGKDIYRLNKIENQFDKLYAHAFHTPRKINKLPIFWRQLIIWMTQKNPKNRPGLADLEQWLIDSIVPKSIRKLSIKPVKTFPKDSLTALADAHYLYAQFKRATLFEVEGQLESAFNLYEGCAFQGYTRAENNLGLMYEKGMPVRQSYSQAMHKYYQAYQQGNPFSSYNLGRLFEQGIGVPLDATKAFKLFEFAALRGHLGAQNTLGVLYAEGKGIVKDLVKARFWLAMAAHYGHPEASDNIQKLLESS